MEMDYPSRSRLSNKNKTPAEIAIPTSAGLILAFLVCRQLISAILNTLIRRLSMGCFVLYEYLCMINIIIKID